MSTYRNQQKRNNKKVKEKQVIGQKSKRKKIEDEKSEHEYHKSNMI